MLAMHEGCVLGLGLGNKEPVRAGKGLTHMNECVRWPEILHEIVNGYWMRKIWTSGFAAACALGGGWSPINRTSRCDGSTMRAAPATLWPVLEASAVVRAYTSRTLKLYEGAVLD